MDEIRICTILGAKDNDAEWSDAGFRADHGGQMNTPPDAMRLALEKKWMWEPGDTIRVRFLEGGSSYIRKMVQKYALVWTEYANIKIKFTESSKADVRIAFKKGDGSWSLLGTGCRDRKGNVPTMNFGWFTDRTPEEEFSRTVTHEFGHALGCIHEHQNPAGKIPWNEAAVYKYYKEKYGWDKATVKNNIFKPYSKSITQYSAFDKKSIMLYSIPKALTTNGFEVKGGSVLSETDKKFIARAYPFGKKKRHNDSDKDSSSGSGSDDEDSDDSYSSDSPSIRGSDEDSDYDKKKKRKQKKKGGKRGRGSSDNSDDDLSDSGKSILSDSSMSISLKKKKKGKGRKKKYSSDFSD